MIDPQIEEETLSITFPAASGEPYERYDKDLDQRYYERLVCTPEAVNLTRLKGGASILKNHDSDDILGTVEDAWIEEGKLVIRARFRKNSFAAVDTFRDIVDGTLKKVSIGYFPEVTVPVMENGVQFRDVTRWTVFEVSVAVGVPADPTVGFYRSMDLKTKENTMSEEEKEKACGEEPEEVKACGEEKAEPSADEAEKACSEEEKSCGDEVKAEEETPSADEAEAEKACGEEAKAEEEKPAEEKKAEPASLETRAAELHITLPKAGEIKSLNVLTKKGKTMDKKYSLIRAFQSLVNPGVDASLERSVSDEMCRSMGKASDPRSIMLSFREGEFIDASSNGAGLVGVQHRGDLFVQALRTRMGVKGATIIGGLTQPIDIPAQTGVSTIGVKALDAAVDRTRPTVASINMAPKKFGAETVIGEDLLLQGNPDAISVVVNDLEAQIARKLDLAILKGIDSPEILGVDGTTGVQTQTVASLAAITWQDVLAMYGKIADYEVEEGDLAFVTKGTTKAALMGITKATYTGRMICDEDGTINGLACNVCGALTAEDFYLGCWKNVYIGQWGGLEVRVDPYTGLSEGSVKIVARLYADIAITNPASFVKRVGAGSN